MAFFKDFLAAQKEMEGATKNAKNPHLKNKYADLASVIDAVKGPLNNNGISFTQEPSQAISVESGVLYVETITTFRHVSGYYEASSIKVPTKANPTAHDIMSAGTYGKRYGLQSYCGIPSEDDDANKAVGLAAGSSGVPADTKLPEPAAPVEDVSAAYFTKYKIAMAAAKDFKKVNELDAYAQQSKLSAEHKAEAKSLAIGRIKSLTTEASGGVFK